MSRTRDNFSDTRYPQCNCSLVSTTSCEAALRFDANSFYPADDSLRTKYKDDNRIVYFALINTWYALLKEAANAPVPELIAQLSNGLLPLIAAAQETADAIIRQQPLPVNVFRLVVFDAANADSESIRIALQALRYPKRFSPFVTDALEAQNLQEFRNRNNRAKMLNRKELPYWLCSRVKDVIHTVLADYTVGMAATSFTRFAALPKGATAEGAKTPYQKLICVERELPLYLYPYNVGVVTGDVASDHYCKVVTVPKSYKTRRVIAEEQCYRQTVMYGFFLQLDRCIERATGKYGTAGRVTLHDQTRNQKMAREGSVSGKYATIDLSAASDSVLATLVRQTFPAPIVQEWDAWRSDYALIDGKKALLHLYSTMGSRLTFPIETILFWAIACVAVEEAALLLEQPFTVDDISVYGDDCVVPTWSYDTFVDFLEMLGFIVNNDKSFYDGVFRESCGCDYYAGYDISSKYYPRQPMALVNGEICSPSADVLAQLLSLQHRLVGHREANAFLIELILQYEPQMTTSPVGSDHIDIWSDYVPVSTRNVPLYEFYDREGGIRGMRHIGDHPDIQREYHYVQTTSYANKTQDQSARLAYATFLQEGPYYASPLDELLRVSTSRTDVGSLESQGKTKLVRRLL